MNIANFAERIKRVFTGLLNQEAPLFGYLVAAVPILLLAVGFSLFNVGVNRRMYQSDAATNLESTENITKKMKEMQQDIQLEAAPPAAIPSEIIINRSSDTIGSVSISEIEKIGRDLELYEHKRKLDSIELQLFMIQNQNALAEIRESENRRNACILGNGPCF